MLPKQLEQVIARAREIDAELAEIEARDEITEDDATRVDSLIEEGDGLAARRVDLEARMEARSRVAKAAEKPENLDRSIGRPVVDKSRSPYDVLEDRGASVGEVRAAAREAVQREDFVGSDYGPAVARLLDTKDRDGVLSRRVLLTGSDAYRSAFVKALAGGVDSFTDAERRAVSEMRAASLTDAAGGFAVPFPIDPTLILTGDGSSNPFRQISRVETGTTDSWQGISAAQVTASWDGEAAEVSDDTPVWAQPKATAKKAQAFVPASIEITQDYPGLAGDLVSILVDAKDNLEAVAFATGAVGGNNPDGVVPLVVAYDTGSSIQASAGADAFAVGDVYATQAKTPPRNRSAGSWVANLLTINLIRQFGTANNHALLTQLADGQPPTLLGQPLYESSAMDGVINAAAENYMLLHGDFNQFLIYDRVGMSVELIPHLFATANNLPSGQRGWYAHWRVGTALLDGNAFTVLNVT